MARPAVLPAAHVHEINPQAGFFVSWNNKPAPGFSAADDQYGYGQVYRSVMLVRQLRRQFRLHHDAVTRADVVKAMETAASQDLDGVTVMPLLLRYLHGPARAGGRRGDAAASCGRGWPHGAHRRKARPGDTQYAHAAAVAISDELMPRLIRALYDPILAAGGVGSAGSNGGATAPSYRKLPMQFVNTPNSGGAHLGSAYDGGYESYVKATLRAVARPASADGFGREITSRECAGGPRTCVRAIDGALQRTYKALVNANGTANVGNVDGVARPPRPPAGRCRCTTRSSSARWASSASRRSTGRTARPSSRWSSSPSPHPEVTAARHPEHQWRGGANYASASRSMRVRAAWPPSSSAIASARGTSRSSSSAAGAAAAPGAMPGAAAAA